MELWNIFMYAIALSMDTFSLSLGIGTYNIENKSIVKLSLMVGLMHFIMPFLGDIIGDKMIQFFSLNSNLFLGCILLFIAGNLLVDMLKKDEKIELDLSFLGMFFFAFGVSIDAFSTGLALSAITTSKILACIIFSITSFCFTFFGLRIGKFANEKLGNKASIFGLCLLIILGISHLCK